MPGAAVFLIAVIMLVRSLAGRNAYEILLSSAALLFWAVLGSAGALAVRRHGAAVAGLEPLWKPPLPLTAASSEEWQVYVSAVHLPLFFRLHFIVRGRFFPQGSAERGGCAVFAETSLPRCGGTAPLDLSFPLGGLFQGEGSFRLRDIFGFFSFPCGLSSKQTLKVRSAPCADAPLRIEALSGAEDRRIKSSSNEERYYMREYTPGDRLRDINWKSSGRIDTLITRISPDNREKVTLIEVCFRNYGPGRASISELWLLDRAKARLAWFLRSAKGEKASFVFHIRSAGGSWELKGEEEIDAFLEELAALPFLPAQSGEPYAAQTEGGGEVYVFSTACDAGLAAFLLTRQGQPVTLFLAQSAVRRNAAEGKAAGAECDCLRLRDFPAGGSVPLPSWFFQRRERLLNVSCGRMTIDYAETRL